MTDREKLVELLTAYFGVDPAYYGIEAAHLADHLLATGVIVLPCKVGDWVYMVQNGEIHRNHVCQVHIAQTYAQTFFSCYGEKFGVEQIGKTVFLSREEAEAALRKEGQ